MKSMCHFHRGNTTSTLRNPNAPLHAKEAISRKNPRNVADIWQDLDSYPRHRKEKGNKAAMKKAQIA